jgi:hypothetical protein
MKKFDSTIAPGELLISLPPVIVVWVVFSLVLIFVSNYLAGSADPFRVVCLGLLALAMAGMAWLLDHWRPQVGRWFAVIAGVILVFLGMGWLETSAFLALVAMPVALAAILIGLTGAVAVAIGESLLLLFLPQFIVAEIGLGSTLIVLAAVWLMIAVYYLAKHSRVAVRSGQDRRGGANTVVSSHHPSFDHADDVVCGGDSVHRPHASLCPALYHHRGRSRQHLTLGHHVPVRNGMEVLPLWVRLVHLGCVGRGHDRRHDHSVCDDAPTR